MVLIPNARRLGDMPSSEPVPEGLYHIRCDKSDFKKAGPNAKNPGAPMAEVQFTIFGPEEAEGFVGRKLFENFMLDGDGMFRVRQYLEATGEDEEYVLEDTDDLLQRECGAVVAIEPEGKDPKTGKAFAARNRITRFVAL